MARPIVYDIEEYYLLKRQQELLAKRIKDLREKIINTCFMSNDKQEFFPAFPVDGWNVSVVMRRKQRLDDWALENLLVSKGLWDECKKEVPDHSLVEQAYIEGKLTDNDMREIDGGRDLIPALHIERVEELTDVQANDESDSEQSGD